MIQFMEHRVADPRILRLIRKWLKAGVMEEGNWSESQTGTAQGSVISPWLANVYLHYSFDLWVNVWRQKWAKGEVVVIRYADDSIAGFQYQTDADRFLENLRERLAQFGLELHPDKTRRIEFGRFAEENRRRRGEGKPETVCSSAQDDPQAHTGQAWTHQAGAPQANARSLVPNRAMAQIDRARPLQLLRGTRQHR